MLIKGKIGLIKKLFASDSMNRKLDPDAKTYWIVRKQKPFDPKQYEHQF